MNTRISESHCDLFEKVDGASSHKVALDLALGREPAFPSRGGRYPVAGKFFLRTYGDALVQGVPSDAAIREVEQAVPGTTIQVLVDEGARLSELMDQDSYSYCLALVFIGGQDEADLEAKYRQVSERLAFQLEQAA
ncbi:MAG: hypothetical protein R6V11_06290 [Ectothiorhodospiraceae bacterium]